MLPPRDRIDEEQLSLLVMLLAARKTVVLSGAGISTESGIPDYRSAPGARRRRPMRFAEFVESDTNRRRYWARAARGWRVIRDAAPSAGHLSVARLQAAGFLRSVVTQNVDQLHQKAGSDGVIELHGTLFRVVCLGCGTRMPRESVQAALEQADPVFMSASTAPLPLPDGDAEVDDAQIEGFAAPQCRGCGGPLKPDVVFFGEPVPKAHTERARAAVQGAEALLVLGSSLAVHSGLRFVEQARAQGCPIAIINLGPTFGDRHATIKLEAPLGPALSALATALRC